MKKKYRKLIKALKKYIKLLDDELNEAVGMAHIHGWKSTRYEAGVKARNKIEKAEKKLKE